MTNETNEMCVFCCTFTGSHILFSMNFRVCGTQKKKAMQVHAVLFHASADFRLHTTLKRQVARIFWHEMTWNIEKTCSNSGIKGIMGLGDKMSTLGTTS